jgi:glucose-1-phosphate adenylyltransferase
MHIIPQSVEEKRVFGYKYEGYWADVGTIRAYYDVNLEIASKNPPFSLIDEGWPIYTHPRYLPGSQIEESKMKDVLIGEGCWIQKSNISRSIIGLRSQIRGGNKIKRSILMGTDYYGFFRRGDVTEKDMVLGIGSGCDIEGAIIDKNSSIGPGSVIHPFPRGVDMDEDLYVVRDGIVVIPKGTRLPPGTHIAPD